MTTKMIRIFAFSLALSLLTQAPQAKAQNGLGSWYELPGRMACGGRMNPQALTAAHRTLPCGTRIAVTNRRTGQSVVVRVTDRGPFRHGRIVDLSRAAAERIGMKAAGVAPVAVRVIGR
jgi:rare lipoprotein A